MTLPHFVFISSFVTKHSTIQAIIYNLHKTYSCKLVVSIYADTCFIKSKAFETFCLDYCFFMSNKVSLQMLFKSEYIMTQAKIVSSLISLNKPIPEKYVQLLYLFLFNLKMPGLERWFSSQEQGLLLEWTGILFPKLILGCL